MPKTRHPWLLKNADISRENAWCQLCKVGGEAKTMRPVKTCHCGHRKGDPEIQEEPEYTTWGWILLSMFGMTPRPDHIVFRCMYCRAGVGISRDPKLLACRSQPTDPKAAPKDALRKAA